MFDLGELKHVRRKLGLTQAELAKKANVSQSLIAKIESRRLDPTLSKAQQIFNTLEALSHTKQQKAADIMTKKVISIKPDSTIKAAIQKMKEFEISQLPVIDHGKILGLVSETTILNSIAEHKTVIRDIMEDSPPVVSKEVTLSVVSDLLRFYPLVLIRSQGKVAGAITKADIIRNYKA